MSLESNPKNIGLFGFIAICLTTIIIYAVNKSSSNASQLYKENLSQVQPVSNDYSTSKQSPVNYGNETSSVNVLTIKGNGMRKSKVFHLFGTQAKILFKYTSTIDQIGVFNVFIVRAGENLMKTGGIPEITSSKPYDSGESYIQEPEGEYYVQVMAAGNWSIKIESLSQ